LSNKTLMPVRVFDFNLIPQDLLLQLKGDEFLNYNEKDLERLYLYGQIVAQDKLTQIYALVDEGKKIRGVLWLSIDPITLWMYITLLVIDKSFQNYKENVKAIYEFCKKIKQRLGLRGLRALTKTPKAFCKMFGAKRSKLTLVEV